MSQAKNRHEAERWLRTAEEGLQAAEIPARAGLFSQACFFAQQSGEKAIKALWRLADADPWGHSVQRLAREFPLAAQVPGIANWEEWGALLDQYYIPTRCPNGLPDLTPGQVYRAGDAERALEAAHRLTDACREWLEAHLR